MHPLANISEQVTGTAHLTDTTNNLQTDENGNFLIGYQLTPVVLMLKPLASRPQYINSKGDIIALNVKCYVVRGLVKSDLQRLHKIELADGRSIVEVNSTQRLLKVLNKIFGVQFIGLLS